VLELLILYSVREMESLQDEKVVEEKEEIN
jgi:hypothetical protein